METLEFVLDADRYRAAYDRLAQPSGDAMVSNASEQICSLWRKVIEAYIMPCAPREINIPAHVRDRLLQLQYAPPDPSELDEAVQIVHELMNDSVLVPFLESAVPSLPEIPAEEDFQELRQGRSRLRIPREGSSSRDEASQSPRTTFLPLLGISRSVTHRPMSTSTDLSETELVTDDSSSPNSTSGVEPITPPTTPRASDFTSSGSPNTFQRAISGSSWKRMGAKLGLRKSKSSRSTNQGSMSSFAEMDAVSVSEPDNRLPL